MIEPGALILRQLVQAACAHCAGTDHIARAQHHGLRGACEDVAKRPEDIVEVAARQLDAVHSRHHFEIVNARSVCGSIGDLIVRDDHRSKRTGEILRFDRTDRKSTRLNSSHSQSSYAVFCLKKQSEPEQVIYVWWDALGY